MIAHELLYLVERRHDDRFKALLSQHLPHWRLLRAELNRALAEYEAGDVAALGSMAQSRRPLDRLK